MNPLALGLLSLDGERRVARLAVTANLTSTDYGLSLDEKQ
jgi:hypothetical protein